MNPIKILSDECDVEKISMMIHVMGYNYGEIAKAILWALKYKKDPEKRKAYLVHMVTNLSDLYKDIEKMCIVLGLSWTEFCKLSDAREAERMERFERKGRPYI